MTVLATLPLARLSTALLLAAVKDVSKAAAAKYSVPILTGMRLTQLSNGMLEVAGFNYETCIRRRIPMDGDLSEVLVPGALFRTALQKLDTKQDVHLAMENGSFVITQNRKRVAVKPMDLDEYPALPEIPTSRHFTVTGADLDFIGTKVAVFAGKDDMLPALTGVRLEVSDSGCLAAMATDRYRLGIAEFPVKMPVRNKAEVSGLVPQMQLIGSLLKGAANVAVSIADGTIFFHSDETTITTRLLDGEFPRVRSLFPDKVDLTATVEPTGFLQAIKFAEAALERNTPVRLHVLGDSVKVAGTSGEEEFSDTVSARITGLDDLHMGFNPGYLTDAIKVFGKEEVSIGFTSNTRPAVFTSEGVGNLRVLLMPVRIKS